MWNLVHIVHLARSHFHKPEEKGELFCDILNLSFCAAGHVAREVEFVCAEAPSSSEASARNIKVAFVTQIAIVVPHMRRTVVSGRNWLNPTMGHWLNGEEPTENLSKRQIGFHCSPNEGSDTLIQVEWGDRRRTPSASLCGLREQRCHLE